eukprot:660266-Lingulodinium_polyedra.AAC.1
MERRSPTPASRLRAALAAGRPVPKRPAVASQMERRSPAPVAGPGAAEPAGTRAALQAAPPDREARSHRGACL